MFCSRCGIEFADDTNFCPSCGLDVAATTPIAAIRDRLSSTEGAKTGQSAPKSEIDKVKEALAGDYDVKKELGRGGMAVVYAAVETALDREVALKILPPSLAHDKEFVERFQREARTSAKLEHPNIIPIYRVGQSGDVIYFAMKFLKGQSLSEMLAKKGTLTVGEIRELLKQCASALGYAHRHEIVHRDIKPDNIMFTDHGQAVVTDFGIAKAASSARLTGTGMAIGTPYYMSPEQARANPVDGRSDLYSLGVVAYQCLAGTVPFDGEDSFAIGYKHIMEPLPIPTLGTAAQRELYDIIARMMAKEPQDRFQNAEELVSLLDGGKSTTLLTGANQSLSEAATTVMPTPMPSAAVGGLRNAPTPTTPMPSSHMDAVNAKGKRPGKPKKKRGGVLVGAFLFMLLIGGGGAGGGYYYTAVLGNPVPDQLAGMLAQLGIQIPEEYLAGSSTEVIPDSAQDTTTLAGAELPADSAAGDSAVAVPGDDSPSDPPEDAPPVAREGTLVISGAPTGARVTINGDPVTGNTLTLNPGSYNIRVAAERYETFSRTVTIAPGQQSSLAVEMTVATQCEAFDTQTYNSDGSCFDNPPIPQSQNRVPYQGNPSPATLALKIGADGRVLATTLVTESDDPQFNIAALRLARSGSLQFTPATKGGRAVEAWMQLQFYPRQ
ncbi:MAG: protein kinase [Gemmatimonadota bacterium]|nr:protein kinase [Gemmatimonadota bacterium]MDH5804103.1 protein kinase [Gemmatimonadota bacterium]